MIKEVTGILVGIAAFLLIVFPQSVAARGFDSGPVRVLHNGEVEYAFSPGRGAEALVLKVIDSAHSEIRMMAYSITSASVVSALLDARKRGVDVALVVDHKSNLIHDQSGKARAALSALANAGCHVRTVSVFPIHHDKVIITDRRTVETGSFNFSKAAATKNSENVIVVWENEELAKGYLEHWHSRFTQGRKYQGQY
jgi:phosphatidylserine/phosphatidylglycerophosphate/cardiolipin synthase-like enzyme